MEQIFKSRFNLNILLESAFLLAKYSSDFLSNGCIKNRYHGL